MKEKKSAGILRPTHFVVWGLIVAAFVIPGLLVERTSYLTFFSRIALIALYALSLNIQFGYGGMINLGSSLYFAMSGYLIIIFVSKLGFPLYAAVLLTLLIEAAFATLFGFVTLKRGMMTFMFLNMGICTLLITFITKTTWLGGQTGLMSNVCPAWLSDKRVRYFFILGVSVALGTVLYLLTKSPMIAALKGARDNQERLVFLGLNNKRLMLFAFVLSSVFMGVAGILYVLLFNSIAPTQMSADISLQALLMCIMGGSTTFVGPVVGAALMLTFTTYMPKVTPCYQLVLGVLMLLFIYFIPRGLIDPQNKAVLFVKSRLKRTAKGGAGGDGSGKRDP